MRIAVVCGGVGAAKLLVGLQRVIDPGSITAIANVGDDVVLHGLHISPDLDTITYTTAGAVSSERGWGLDDESWKAMEMVGRYGGVDWFSLGDRDLGTHLYRTHRLVEGAPLSLVTAEIAAAWDLGFRLLPATDDPLRTLVTVPDDGEIQFQEYFVRLGHDVPITAVRFAGAADATPAPGVLDAIAGADRVIIAPSNPAVSINPVLAVPGIREAIVDRRDDVVAVSPIVGGAALKGPAARMMVELGGEASVVGVAAWYRELAATLLIDTADADLAPAVAAAGMAPVVTETVMSSPTVTDALARRCLA